LFIFNASSGRFSIARLSWISVLPDEREIEMTNRAIYNLTEGPIILPFKNLTLAGQGFRSFRTLSFLIGKEKIWTYTVGGL
jgi:hypothetical protein